MPISNMKNVLLHAQKFGYAVPAFNVLNLEFAKVVCETAQELSAPVILAIHPLEYRYSGLKAFSSVLRTLAIDSKVPVVIHMDHGDGKRSAMETMSAGFSSIMFDGSALDYAENVKLTKEIAELAHMIGVDIEGELGMVGGAEGELYVELNTVPEASMTDPEVAKDFVNLTGIDSLAVAIGNSHGLYKGDPKFDIDRLEAIRSKVEVPLVLHGGSGTTDSMIKTCISLGITKINIATELKKAFHQGITEYIGKYPNDFEPRNFLKSANESMKELVRLKLEMFGTVGQAF